MKWKQRYRWKRYRSKTWWNVQHFPPASGRMTQNSVCLWRHRERRDSNKLWRQRRFEPSQETGYTEDDKWQCVVGIYFIMICGCSWSCKFYLTLCLASSLTIIKSTSTVTLQDVQSNNVTSGLQWPRREVTISVRKYPENIKNRKYATHLSRNLFLLLM